MTCPESRLVEFLAGDLSAEQAASFDEHLLSCESCWQAVQEDRAGRLAIERTRERAPSELAERVVLAVELATREGLVASDTDWPGSRRLRRLPTSVAGRRGPGRRRVGRSTRVAAVFLTAGLIAGALAWVLAGGGAPSDPAQVAAVVALAQPSGSPGGASRPEPVAKQMVVGGQRLTIRSYRVEGILTIVAMSSRPFTMPASAHVMTGSSSAAWMATRGKLALYCVNRSAGHESMLVVAAMPAAQLPQVAARLHLI